MTGVKVPVSAAGAGVVAHQALPYTGMNVSNWIWIGFGLLMIGVFFMVFATRGVQYVAKSVSR